MSGVQLSLFDGNSEDSQEFFIRKRSWSAAKHRIMLRYIQSYCYNLGGEKAFQSKHLNYIDGFAGEGKYNEGFGVKDFVNESKLWKRYEKINLLDTDGSPLIALKCAKAFREENRVNLRCFLAEKNRKRNQKLHENCEAVGAGLDYKIYPPKTFDDIFPEIMADLDDYPSIFFLDSYGVKGVNFEQISLIGNYVSRHKGELFLLFHNSAVARHAGFLTLESTNKIMKKTAETYMQNLTRFLGPSSDKDWKPQWLALKDKAQQFERWALQYFIRRILNETRFKGVASFEIKERYNDARPQYSIVVCSNHPPKAFGEFLNDFFADENKRLLYEEDKEQLNRTFLNNEWNRQVEKRKKEVQPKIVEILRNKQQWLTVEKAITEIILGLIRLEYDLGYLKRSDYKALLNNLLKQNVIQGKFLGKKGDLVLEKSMIKLV